MDMMQIVLVGSRAGGIGGGMSAAQRQEVAASAGGAVEQAVLRSLGVLDQQARAAAEQSGTIPASPPGKHRLRASFPVKWVACVSSCPLKLSGRRQGSEVKAQVRRGHFLLVGTTTPPVVPSSLAPPSISPESSPLLASSVPATAPPETGESRSEPGSSQAASGDASHSGLRQRRSDSDGSSGHQ